MVPSNGSDYTENRLKNQLEVARIKPIDLKTVTAAENRARMAAGQLYDPSEASLMADQGQYQRDLAAYNQLPFQAGEVRTEWLQAHFAAFGAGSYIEQPFYANWGGHHVHVGANVYANFHLTLVDDGEIFIGDHVMMGPNVTLVTAGHPVQPALRAQAYQYNQPVHLATNVWLGANVTVLPGVTIGENTVVGAGSLVTRDLPANVVAVGTPAKVLRAINDHDREVYFREAPIDVIIPKEETQHDH